MSYYVIKSPSVNRESGVDENFLCHIMYGMETPRMGRPPKNPDERRDDGLRIPLTSEEKALIEQCAEAAGKKPITWTREILLKAAKRLTKK